MTVCIAALYMYQKTNEKESPPDHREVILASDRMLSAGDIKYEPVLEKIGPLSERVVVMVSGNISTHSEAILAAKGVIHENQEKTVEGMAHIYANQLRKITTRHAVQAYLAPLGLDENSFISHQQEMSPFLVADLTSKLQEFRLEVEAIVTGFNSVGNDAQLYVIGSDCIATCSNDIGFAAIGEGGWHAKSHFMFAGYTKNSTFAAGVYHAYAAKKRAEIAPHVGTTTDLYVGMWASSFTPLIPSIRSVVEKVYQDQEKQKTNIDSASVSKLLEAYTNDSMPSASQVAGAPPEITGLS